MMPALEAARAAAAGSDPVAVLEAAATAAGRSRCDGTHAGEGRASYLGESSIDTSTRAPCPPLILRAAVRAAGEAGAA